MIHDIFIPFVAENLKNGLQQNLGPLKAVYLRPPGSGKQCGRHPSFKIGDSFADKYEIISTGMTEFHQLMLEAHYKTDGVRYRLIQLPMGESAFSSGVGYT